MYSFRALPLDTNGELVDKLGLSPKQGICPPKTEKPEIALYVHRKTLCLAGSLSFQKQFPDAQNAIPGGVIQTPSLNALSAKRSSASTTFLEDRLIIRWDRMNLSGMSVNPAEGNIITGIYNRKSIETVNTFCEKFEGYKEYRECVDDLLEEFLL